MECRVFPFSRLTTASFLHFKRMKNIETCKSARIKEKYALMQIFQQDVQHLKLEIGVWDYDRLGPSEVIGSVVLAGGKDLNGQGCSLILGQVSSLISNRTQGKFSSDPGPIIVYPCPQLPSSLFETWTMWWHEGTLSLCENDFDGLVLLTVL